MAAPRNSRQLLLLSGTASIPGLSFVGDTNTGIFRTSADRLDFTTGGVSRLYVDASGNTTVTGNASISGNLTVTGTVTSSGTGSVVTVDGVQTLTNKTLTAPKIATISNTGTLTLPTSTDTLVGRATTDTITNKSISGATNTLSAIPGTAINATSVPVSAINATGTASASTYLRGDGAWAAASSARGGGSDAIFFENGQTVTTNYTITTGQNAMSAGPISINSGVTVTVPSGSTWTIV